MRSFGRITLSTKRKILKYVYSKSILHFDNYLHHLRNIYLGIRFYLQKGYMNKRFVKDDVEVYNKFYCYIIYYYVLYVHKN
jgi:hypothetical protein